MSTNPIDNSAPQVSKFTCMNLPILQPVINEVVENTQAPIEMVLFTALAAVAVVCQGLFTVETRLGSTSPLSLMIMIVAESGERKSAVEGHFFQSIRSFEKEQHESLSVKMQKWHNDMVVWKVQEGVLKRAFERRLAANKPSEAAKEAFCAHNSLRSSRPSKYQILYEDVTPKALYRGLYEGCRSAGLVSSEGDTILNGLVLQDLSKLNTLFSGDIVTIDRSDYNVTLHNTFVTILTLAQPGVVAKFKGRRGEHARNTGFLARHLVVKPVSTIGGRFAENATPSWQHITAFEARTQQLAQQYKTAVEGQSCVRKTVKFSAEAMDSFLNIRNSIEAQTQPGKRYAAAKDHASKLADNIARVAALLHCFEDFPGDISKETLDTAINICDLASTCFLEEFVPLSQEEQDAIDLNKWLTEQYREGHLNYRNYCIEKNSARQRAPSHLRKDSRFYKALDILQKQRIIVLFHEKKKCRETEIIDLFPEGVCIPYDAWKHKTLLGIGGKIKTIDGERYVVLKNPRWPS